jgi:hypothetical protein
MEAHDEEPMNFMGVFDVFEHSEVGRPGRGLLKVAPGCAM